jgi:hypothetical protein
MKAKAKTLEKTKAKEKKPAVKAATKAVKKPAAAPKAVKAKKARVAGKKTDIGAEMEKAAAFVKSITLEDLANLGEEGMKRLKGVFAAIAEFGRTLQKQAKTKKTKK